MQAQQKYRARAVDGQFQIQEIGEKRTPQVVGFLEVTVGPDQGQRIRWTGFLTEAAFEATVDELRAMGWKADRLGQWNGLGSREVEFTCLAETNNGKTYLRAAFVRPLRAVDPEKAAPSSTIDALNARLGGHLRATAARTNGGPPRPEPLPTSADPGGDDLDFPPH
jgi:hypothetical protein